MLKAKGLSPKVILISPVKGLSVSFWGANEVFLYLHFLFCLPKSFFFLVGRLLFCPGTPRFCPPGVAPHGLGFNQRATCAPSLPYATVQCGNVRARGIAQPLVLRDFLWGISIVSLAPHSLGHPSLRIPSAGWLGGRGHIVLYCIPCYSSGKSLFALGHQVKRWPSHEKPICSSIRSLFLCLPSHTSV